ncbi:MAG: DNA mismatch endonuclease Vsr [Bacteroidetes bacterium]|nr:DNA mismatch endonuclease Vsr [Bacteroidota bacterium]
MAKPKPYIQPKIKVPRFAEDAGFHTTPQRSEMMSRIRGVNTKPEVALRKALWHFGYRYRIHDKHLPGKPDLVFAKQKTVVFVDGDFWHGYDWRHKRDKIKSNPAFWIPKIERNMQRDREVNAELEALGWQVVRIWEHELKKAEFGATVYRVVRLLGAAGGQIEFLLEDD